MFNVTLDSNCTKIQNSASNQQLISTEWRPPQDLVDFSPPTPTSLIVNEHQSREPLASSTIVMDQAKEDTKKENDSADNLISLGGFVEECGTFEEALEVLNLERSKSGVVFKRGNRHYYECKAPKDSKKLKASQKSQEADKDKDKDKESIIKVNQKEAKLKDQRIICNQKSRNYTKDLNKGRKSVNSKKDSYGSLKDLKPSVQDKSCPVFYKFIYDEDTGEMTFKDCFEHHNHSLGLPDNELTDNMKNDIKLFNKRSKVIEIKESLGKKYGIQLNYHLLYREFRKPYPLWRRRCR